RSIDPVFGTLADADAVIAEGHALGLRTIIDIVPNHCSDRHRWFQAALAAGPGSPERARFWFRPGRGPAGELPPNGWRSEFGGPAWTRTTGPDGTRGRWCLHLFAAEQPDFNWANPEVRAEFEDILRFWFDRGVDGVRIDSAALLTKDPAMPEPGGPSPFTDRDDVHDIYRACRHPIRPCSVCSPSTGAGPGSRPGPPRGDGWTSAAWAPPPAWPGTCAAT